MIDEAAARAAIERCRQITWQGDPRRLSSQVALMKEFLRRAAATAEALGASQEWRWDDFTRLLPLPRIDRQFLPGWIFLDRYGESEYHGPGLGLLEEEVAALQAHIHAISSHGGYYGKHACGWYLRWASSKNQPTVAARGLPDPYEPLILFYERGGSFHRETNFLEMDGAKVTLSTYPSLHHCRWTRRRSTRSTRRSRKSRRALGPRGVQESRPEIRQERGRTAVNSGAS